jgi:hypothetical protein
MLPDSKGQVVHIYNMKRRWISRFGCRDIEICAKLKKYPVKAPILL